MNKSGNSKQVMLRRWRITLIPAILTCVVSACDQVRLDANLCPIDTEPERQTILLLDTSDPLTPKHRSELRRLVGELQNSSSNEQSAHFYIAPREALIVYSLTDDLATVEPIIRVCNPGSNPADLTWKDDLTQGRAIALSQWQRFEESIEPLFPQIESDASLANSPIIEMLGVVVPLHAPSSRSLSPAAENRTHLILFSDLLQHSDLLSHYGPYPAPEAIARTDGLRSLRTDLRGIDVSLFRLERASDGNWQTREHYYWWTELIRELKGTLRWQESI